MIANLRRLLIAHLVLGVASFVVYWAGSGAMAPQSHFRGRGLVLIALLKVLLAWIPYIVSAVHSCSVLPTRNPKATYAFIGTAVAVSILAACLNRNVFQMTQPPTPLMIAAGLTIALLAAASVCAAIWRSELSEWDNP